MKHGISAVPLAFLLCLLLTPHLSSQESKRPMTFMDVMEMKSAGSPDVSADGTMLVYTVTTPSWEERKYFSDIFIADLRTGRGKRMTYTEKNSERSPVWYKDATFFAFISDRAEDKNQIFFMRPDGGEAWQVTDNKEGVGGFEWSGDWNGIAYTAGKAEERQLWRMDGTGETPEKLSSHKTPVQSFAWSPDGKKIYFTAPDRVDSLEKKRMDKKFDVEIKDKPEPPSHLWDIDVETKE